MVGQERYHVAHDLIEDKNQFVRRTGYSLFIDLLLKYPDAVAGSLQRLQYLSGEARIEPSDEELARVTA